MSLPPYVYDTKFENDLCQGDIIHPNEEILRRCEEFYKGIEWRKEGVSRYLMVINQSCDLVRRKDQDSNIKINCSHINVCLVQSFDRFLRYELEQAGDTPLNDGSLYLAEDEYLEFARKASRLVNNSQSKSSFFLPKHNIFNEDKVALLHKSFPFRTKDNYELFATNRVATLLPEFRAKIGYIIADLYGRVATIDLADRGVNSETVYQYVIDSFDTAKIFSAPDSECLVTLKQYDGNKGVKGKQQKESDKIIEEHRRKKIEDRFKPLFNKITNNIRKNILNIVTNNDLRNSFSDLEKGDANKKLTDLVFKENSDEFKKFIDELLS